MKKISVRIAGRHETSLTLEAEFEKQLRQIAVEKNLSLNDLVTQIDSQRDEETNLSSAVRLFVLQYLLEKLNASKTILSGRQEP